MPENGPKFIFTPNSAAIEIHLKVSHLPRLLCSWHAVLQQNSFVQLEIRIRSHPVSRMKKVLYQEAMFSKQEKIHKLLIWTRTRIPKVVNSNISPLFLITSPVVQGPKQCYLVFM